MQPVQYLAILRRRRLTLLATFAIALVTLVTAAFTTVPTYVATAAILIDKQTPRLLFSDVYEQSAAGDDYYETQQQVLQSRALAWRTIESLKLWQSDVFMGRQPRPFSVSGTVGDLAATVSGAMRRVLRTVFPEAPAPKRAFAKSPADDPLQQSAMIDTFLSKVSVTSVGRSRLVEVMFTSTDPTLAASAANALAREYVKATLELSTQSSRAASEWLNQRLEEQQKQVASSERNAQTYLQLHDASSLEEQQNIVARRLGDLNAALSRAKEERIQRETLYQQLRGIQSDPSALDRFPGRLSTRVISRLRTDLAALEQRQARLSENYGENHPEMRTIRAAIASTQSRLRGEIAKVVESVANEYLTAQAQERSLLAALEAQKRDTIELNRKAIQYGPLQHEAAADRQLLANLTQRAGETVILSDAWSTNIRIVDPADVPRLPASGRGASLLMALAVAATFSVGMALLVELVDNRIRTPEQAESFGVRFLGPLPMVRRGAEDGVALFHADAGFAEAVRFIRTNLLFSLPEEKSRTLVVTSAEPSEGKTVFASNISLALAQLGKRVLLIDGDTRCPRLHTIFNRDREPGLTNLIAGDARAAEAVRNTDVPGLWILPAGHLPPNPAELLVSGRFARLVAGLSARFDWILIDSPPLLAVVDPVEIGRVASGLVLVIGAGIASRRTVANALDSLQAPGVPIVGAVLNRVDVERSPSSLRGGGAAKASGESRTDSNMYHRWAQ